MGKPFAVENNEMAGKSACPPETVENRGGRMSPGPHVLRHTNYFFTTAAAAVLSLFFAVVDFLVPFLLFFTVDFDAAVEELCA
jgi:hypothetical protein